MVVTALYLTLSVAHSQVDVGEGEEREVTKAWYYTPEFTAIIGNMGWKKIFPQINA